MNLRLFLSAAAVAAVSSTMAACAPPYDPKAARTDETAPGGARDAGIEAVRDNITRVLPQVARDDVRRTEAPGLYEIQQGTQFAYVTADGRYLIEGDLVDVLTGDSLTENKRKSVRIARLAELGEENMIVFKPQNADAEHMVTVFTDIDCGYCRKLHREIEEYNKRGIGIRYVFYPRTGPKSESFRKAEAVWCAEDRKQALTLAKQGAPVDGPADCPNPVAREFELGGELGLRGTPMLVLPDGEVVNGYVPAAALAERLNERGRG
ncbi:MAG: DsbC family protein [Pseudomonadota bacterium]